jgi:squalene-hopene/tetraprenyl-beta-curcumene cyclase
MRLRVRTAIEQGLRYLAARQGDDGSWVPLWFGNDGVPGHLNPVYGTARVVLGLREVAGMGYAVAPDMLSKGARFLVQQQSPEGGWGGAAGVSPSVEETALAVCALRGGEGHDEVLARGMAWLCASLNRPVTPRPIGLYFASLWYFEKRYPDVFALAALRP